MGKTCLDKQDVVKILAMIRVNFENAYRGTKEDNRLLVDSWYAILRDYPREAVYEATKRALMHAEFAPRIGTIVNEIERMMQSLGKSDAELWSELASKLYNAYSYAHSFWLTARDANGRTQGEIAREKLQKLYDGLSAEIREYLGSVQQLAAFADYDAEQLTYERARFMKTVPVLRERVKIRAQLSPAMATLLSGIEKPLIGEGEN